MSLIFGQINANQAPASVHHLAVMYGGIKHFPHEKHQFLGQENAAFGHALTHNTPEALHEQMPVYEADSQTLFVAEGRIDNREALTKTLGIGLAPTLPDGELMRQAYLRWGEACADKLQGDWSLAAYNFKTQTLFVARDKLGYTALFYHFNGRQFSFGSSIKSLLALKTIPKNKRVDYLIRELALWKSANNETVYKGIFMLPPGHTLTLKNGQIALKRYWFPENVPLIYYKNPQDYAEELRQILTEAVQVRLRSHRPVAAMLSGGLDSGTVAYLAAQLLKPQNQRLRTLSHVPLFGAALAQEKNAGWFLDETPYIMATAQAAGNIDPTLLNSAHLSVTQGIAQQLDINDTINHAAGNVYWLIDIMQTAQRMGFGALLTGEMGNAGISFTGIDYLLPLTHARFLQHPKRLIKSRILRPLAMQYFKSLLSRRSGVAQYIMETSHLRHDMLKAQNVIAQMGADGADFYQYYPTAKAGMLHILATAQLRCMFGANSKHYFGVEKRDPTGDVRVLEYCLAVPNGVFFDEKGQNKQLLRRMMQGRLPDKVLFETKKGLQSADIAHRARTDQQATSEWMARVCQNADFQEIVDVKKLQTDWQQFLAGQQTGTLQMQTVFKTLMVGMFLEH